MISLSNFLMGFNVCGALCCYEFDLIILMSWLFLVGLLFANTSSGGLCTAACACLGSSNVGFDAIC